MTEGFAGWIPDELPASKHLRSVQEILTAPPTAAERRQLQREQAEAGDQAARAQDLADGAAAQGWVARMRGEPPRSAAEVLAGSRDELDREQHDRRRAAARILREHGLADVLGVPSGVVLDANMGILEPVEDQSARAANAAADRRYEFERGQREADERNRIVARSKVQLEERRRALGLDSARVSYRSADPGAERRRYEQACREIGCAL
jgi:hypothetical protein